MIPYHRPFVQYNKSYMLSNGETVKALEKAIKELYDVEYVIACSSCSQGLLLTLQASSFVDEEIATPSFAWYSSMWAINMFNKTKFIDINKTSWLMNESRNQVSMPVHTFGNIVEYNSPFVLYDGAHALGSRIKDFGLATVFSLAPTKLVTSCEGGIIVCTDKEMAEEIRYLRDIFSRMSEPNAAYGLETLKSLDEILAWKKKLFNYYSSNLPGIFQQIPHSSNYNTIGFLTDLKIPSHIECRKYYEPLDFSLPNTKFVYNKIVCLPSWYGVDYEKITNDILEYNESLNNGRLRVFGDSNSQVPGS